MDAVFAGRLSRRELVGAVLVSAGAGVLVSRPGLASAAAPQPDDGELLTSALQIEQLAAVCYEQVLGAGLLDAHGQAVVGALLDQERAHAAALAADLQALGRPVPAVPADVDAADAALAAKGVSGSLVTMRTAADGLKLLLQVVSLAQGAYYDVILNLRSTAPLQGAVQALASEAQHETLLSLLQRPGNIQQAVPYSFVEGTR